MLYLIGILFFNIAFLFFWSRFQNHVKGKDVDLMDIAYKQSARDYPKGAHIPR